MQQSNYSKEQTQKIKATPLYVRAGIGFLSILVICIVVVLMIASISIHLIHDSTTIILTKIHLLPAVVTTRTRNTLFIHCSQTLRIG